MFYIAKLVHYQDRGTTGGTLILFNFLELSLYFKETKKTTNPPSVDGSHIIIGVGLWKLEISISFSIWCSL